MSRAARGLLVAGSFLLMGLMVAHEEDAAFPEPAP